LLDRLRDDFDEDAFDVVDRWEADLCAIGIAAHDDHRRLVYISTWGWEGERFSFELEGSTDTDGMVEGVTYDELRRAIEAHLDAGT
jgi:hypothetical protein